MDPTSTVVPPSPVGAVTSRFSALTMPLVTVPASPRGAPSATTGWPTLSASASPRGRVGSPEPSTFSTARSVFGSRPTSLAGLVVPSFSSTSIWPPRAASEMTWSLVTTTPSALLMAPLPVPASLPLLAATLTTAGSTSRATRMASQLPDAAARHVVIAQPPTRPPTRPSRSAPISTGFFQSHLGRAVGSGDVWGGSSATAERVGSVGVGGSGAGTSATLRARAGGRPYAGPNPRSRASTGSVCASRPSPLPSGPGRGQLPHQRSVVSNGPVFNRSSVFEPQQMHLRVGELPVGRR